MTAPDSWQKIAAEMRASDLFVCHQWATRIERLGAGGEALKAKKPREFDEWFWSASHRQKYLCDHPAYLAAFETWEAMRATPPPSPDAAVRDVIAERERQKGVEGWTPEHDDHHDEGELALAASCYAYCSAQTNYEKGLHHCPPEWPWHSDWWKPKDRRRDLVRAGALILAEIERLDRALAGDGSA